MASVKSILAAIDTVTVTNRHTSSSQWAGTRINGWFRPTGFTQVENIDLVLSGRLGRLEVTISIVTDHAHTHNDNGEVIATTVSKPVTTIVGKPEGVSLTDVKRACSRLGCNILDY